MSFMQTLLLYCIQYSSSFKLLSEAASKHAANVKALVQVIERLMMTSSSAWFPTMNTQGPTSTKPYRA